jgi:hypothetical protein
MPCNATYCGVTSCLLTTTVTVVVVEAAEKVFQIVFQMALYSMWIDGNTVPSTERSSRLRKEKDTHCVLWNLNANAGLTTVLRVVLPPFSVDFTIIIRGLYLRSSCHPTTVLGGHCYRSRWKLPSILVELATIIRGIIPSWKRA